MAISVSWQAEYEGILAAAGALGPWLRIIQVAQENSYTNATTPASNFTASIPWSRASATSAPLMSGLCYLFGAQVVMKQPDLPVGMISTAWGGVRCTRRGGTGEGGREEGEGSGCPLSSRRSLSGPLRINQSSMPRHSRAGGHSSVHESCSACAVRGRAAAAGIYVGSDVESS